MKEHTRGVRISQVLVTALLVIETVGIAVISKPVEVQAAGSRELEQYKALMVNARQMYPYPQSVEKMYRVMMCESGGNPKASGARGSYLGLFQYAPATWRGSWNPYRNASIWDVKAQIYATAKAWSIGMQGRWGCFSKTK